MLMLLFFLYFEFKRKITKIKGFDSENVDTKSCKTKSCGKNLEHSTHFNCNSEQNMKNERTLMGLVRWWKHSTNTRILS